MFTQRFDGLQYGDRAFFGLDLFNNSFGVQAIITMTAVLAVVVLLQIKEVFFCGRRCSPHTKPFHWWAGHPSCSLSGLSRIEVLQLGHVFMENSIIAGICLPCHRGRPSGFLVIVFDRFGCWWITNLTSGLSIPIPRQWLPQSPEHLHSGIDPAVRPAVCQGRRDKPRFDAIGFQHFGQFFRGFLFSV